MGGKVRRILCSCSVLDQLIQPLLGVRSDNLVNGLQMIGNRREGVGKHAQAALLLNGVGYTKASNLFHLSVQLLIHVGWTRYRCRHGIIRCRSFQAAKECTSRAVLVHLGQRARLACLLLPFTNHAAHTSADCCKVFQ